MNRLFRKLLVSPPLIIWGIIISPVILLGVSSAALSSRIFKENLIYQVEAQANNSATRINNYTQLIKAQAIAAGNFAVAEQYLSLLNHIHEPQTDLNKASKLLPQLQHYMRDQVVVGQHLDHIRYINKDAREIIRIDRDRKKFTLKDTSNRAYFHETMKLQRGELYVSPINLNREGASGFLEEPHKPVVRIATPVYNLDNQIEGIFIANILADRIFDFADNQLLREKYGTQLMIVNQEGYYLRHPNPAMEFGFEIKNDQLKLSIDNPTLAIQSENNRDQKSNNFQI